MLFATAVSAGVMRQEQATLLVASSRMSMALTPLLVALAPRLIREEVRERDENFDGAEGSVLLIGFGRFGQVVSQMLLPEGVEVTAIDNDLEMIEAAEQVRLQGVLRRRRAARRAARRRRRQARLICVCVDRKEARHAHRRDRALRLSARANLRPRVRPRPRARAAREGRALTKCAKRTRAPSPSARRRSKALELTAERIAELEADVRCRDRERFALQQQGDRMAGLTHLVTRPIPRPEPLVNPKRRGVALNPDAKPET